MGEQDGELSCVSCFGMEMKRREIFAGVVVFGTDKQIVDWRGNSRGRLVGNREGQWM